MAESGARLAACIAQVGPLDREAIAVSRGRWEDRTRPAGGLGRLERLATQVVGITGCGRPRLPNRAVVVTVADHGVAAEGVSAYPAAVTAQMVHNFAAGGAAINVLAR